MAQFLRARARWRLDSAGASANHAARSVVSLLDAAAYLGDVPDDDPDIVTLDTAGCFRGEAFDPGPEGALLVRQWQLAETTMDPRHRTLRRIRIEDAAAATDMFSLLMGSEVAPRRDFIVSSAAELDPSRIDI